MNITKLAQGFQARFNGQGRRMLNWPKEKVREETLALAGDLIAWGKQLKPERQHDFIKIASLAVQIHDADTHQHQLRVPLISYHIGYELHLPWPELKDLLWAASTHDFGKVFIPKEVLNKNGAWDEDEIDYKRLHLLTAFYIFDSIPYLKGAAGIIANQHIFDGYTVKSGPQRLSLATEILSAVDCFDARIFPRSYHDGFERNHVLRRLEERKYDQRILQLITGLPFAAA